MNEKPHSKSSSLYLKVSIVLLGFLIFVWSGSYSWHKRPPKTPPRLRAKATTGQLSNTFEGYFAEYGELPQKPADGATKGDTEVNSNDGWLVAALNGGNPKQLNYLDGMAGVNPDNPTILDPWGTAYRIRLDTDGDGYINLPTGAGKSAKRALVWSAGPDGNFDTWGDNVVSW